MSDHTPMAGQIRQDYIDMAVDVEYRTDRDTAGAEFDRWLAAERARIWDEGYVAGSLHGLGPLALDNPYRTENE